jgi:hypothetical protein
MKDNVAECEKGEFVSKDFEYTGVFKNNMLHGKGRERTLNHNYIFQGIYWENQKK